MKTKPNFTYKEFIQKISNVNINNKDKPNKKSPRALKSQNKNIPSIHDHHLSNAFQKRSTKKQTSVSKVKSPNLSPRKIQTKENVLQQSLNNQEKSTNLKSTTNKKLKLKNQSISFEASNKESSKHSKSILQHSRGNFYHNQSSFGEQRHNESCSTFFKNYNFDNQEEISQIKNMGICKSPSVSSKLTSKKHSSSSIDGKFKIIGKGNLTDRNIQRVNTQYQQKPTKPEQRLNTQYQRRSPSCNRESPAFYKGSVDESSFLDFQDDKSHKHLFAESSVSYSKKSVTFSGSQEQRVKINQKSYEHVYNKFISTISQTLFQITKINDQNQLLEHKVKYIEFLECLKELKMIRSDYQPYSQNEGADLVKQLWEQLIMGHNINHFIIIVALILKITPLQYIKSDSSPELQNYIYIQKKYEQFRFTRLQLDKSKSYSQKESIEYYNFPFKPTISKASQEMAGHQKSKKKYKINVSTNHNESLHLNSIRQNVSISTEFDNNQNATSRSISTTSPLGTKRSQILYKEGKKKSLQKRQDKSTIDYEYQKNKNELTFKPKITIKRKIKRPQQSSVDYASPRFVLDEQKAINRMIRGRVQKQIKQMTIDRGIPYNQKMIEKLRKQKFQEIIKEHQQSRLKTCQNQSKIKLKLSQVHNKSKDQNINEKSYEQSNCYDRCTTQVQQLQNLIDLSFQEFSNTDNDQIQNEQCSQKRIQNSPLTGQCLKSQNQEKFNAIEEQKESLDDYFALDIYFEQDRSDKLLIRRDSTIDEVIAEAQRFVLKHKLPPQMSKKLKQQLMIAMKFHDIQKIQQNDEEQECSLLG